MRFFCELEMEGAFLGCVNYPPRALRIEAVDLRSRSRFSEVWVL